MACFTIQHGQVVRASHYSRDYGQAKGQVFHRFRSKQEPIECQVFRRCEVLNESDLKGLFQELKCLG